MGYVKVRMSGDADAVSWMIACMERQKGVCISDIGVSKTDTMVMLDIDTDAARPRQRRTAADTKFFRDEVWRLYLDEHMTQADISRHLGCSQAYVSRIINQDY